MNSSLTCQTKHYKKRYQKFINLHSWWLWVKIFVSFPVHLKLMIAILNILLQRQLLITCKLFLAFEFSGERACKCPWKFKIYIMKEETMNIKNKWRCRWMSAGRGWFVPFWRWCFCQIFCDLASSGLYTIWSFTICEQNSIYHQADIGVVQESRL